MKTSKFEFSVKSSRGLTFFLLMASFLPSLDAVYARQPGIIVQESGSGGSGGDGGGQGDFLNTTSDPALVYYTESWIAAPSLPLNDGDVFYLSVQNLQIVAPDSLYPDAIDPSQPDRIQNCAHAAFVTDAPVSLRSSVVSPTYGSGSMSLFAPSIELSSAASIQGMQGETFDSVINDPNSTGLNGSTVSFDSSGLYAVATGSNNFEDDPLSGQFSIDRRISDANKPLGSSIMGPIVTNDLSNIGFVTDGSSTGLVANTSKNCANFAENPGVQFAISDSNTAIQWEPISITID